MNTAHSAHIPDGTVPAAGIVLRRSTRAVLLMAGFLLVFSSCLSTTVKKIIPPPWTPEVQVSEDRKPPKGQVAPVFWLVDTVSIDGDFSEWDGLVSAEPYVSVYGGYFNPEDASGRFAYATDGETLFLFAEITDDVPNENPLSPAAAWRNDSVEFFIGTQTSTHRMYAENDSQIRIVPVSREDSSRFSLSINDVDFTRQTNARVRYTQIGYTIEAAVPLGLLGIEKLSVGQSVRVEFQINDGDATERDRLVHWMSEKDNPWNDASVWGDGKIVEVAR